MSVHVTLYDPTLGGRVKRTKMKQQVYLIQAAGKPWGESYIILNGAPNRSHSIHREGADFEREPLDLPGEGLHVAISGATIRALFKAICDSTCLLKYDMRDALIEAGVVVSKFKFDQQAAELERTRQEVTNLRLDYEPHPPVATACPSGGTADAAALGAAA